MKWLALVLAAIAAVSAGLLLQARSRSLSSDAEVAHAAVKHFAEALAHYQRRHGHLPGDVNRDGEIDADETAYVAKDLARAGLIRGAAAQITVGIAGRTVILRAIARSASAVPNPPRGRNVIELWNLPCHVARDFDARIDDGNFSKGNVRASVASCAVGGENQPVPAVAVALPP